MIYPQSGQLWKHYKSNQYRILEVSSPGECPDPDCAVGFYIKHTDNKRQIGVVRATDDREGCWLFDCSNNCWLSKSHVIYGTRIGSQHWCRELGEFLEVLPDGKPRFRYLGIAEVDLSGLESIA